MKKLPQDPAVQGRGLGVLVVIAGLEDTVRGLLYFGVYMNSLCLQLLRSPLHSSEAVNKRTEIPLPVKFLYGILYPVPCFYLYCIMCVCFNIALVQTFLNHYFLAIFLFTFQTEQHPCPLPPQWNLFQQSS